jgi:hypothetical protein
MLGCPDGRRETGRPPRDGLGTPAQPIPTLTSALLAIRPPQKVPARPRAGAPPGPPPLPAGRGHRLAGPSRAVLACREVCLPGAGPGPPAPGQPSRPSVAVRRAPPDRPPHRHPAPGRGMAGPGRPPHCRPGTDRVAVPHGAGPVHLPYCRAVTGRRAAAPGRPRHGRPAAGRRKVLEGRAAGPGPLRHCRPVAGHAEADSSVTALSRPGRSPRPGRIPRPAARRPGLRCGALPRPATALPPPEPPRRALAPPGGQPRAGDRRDGGARSGAIRPCRASRVRSTRPGSSPRGTGPPCAPPGWAAAVARGRVTPNRGTPSWPPLTQRRTRRSPRPGPRSTTQADGFLRRRPGTCPRTPTARASRASGGRTAGRRRARRSTRPGPRRGPAAASPRPGNPPAGRPARRAPVTRPARRPRPGQKPRPARQPRPAGRQQLLPQPPVARFPAHGARPACPPRAAQARAGGRVAPAGGLWLRPAAARTPAEDRLRPRLRSARAPAGAALPGPHTAP